MVLRDINRHKIRERFYADVRHENNPRRIYCLVRDVDHSVDRPSVSLAYIEDFLNGQTLHYNGTIAYQVAQNLRPVPRRELARQKDSFSNLLISRCFGHLEIQKSQIQGLFDFT